MRWGIGLAGLFSAVGFAYCGLVYGAVLPNPGVLFWLAGFCLLIVVACLGGLVGNIAGRFIGVVVCLGYIAYFVYELTQADGTLVNGRRSQPSALNALLGFVVFGVPAGGWAIYGGRFYKQEKLFEAGLAGITELEDEMQEVRNEGLVYCGWIEDHELDEAEEIVRTLVPEEEGPELEKADPKAAHAFAESLLRNNVRTGERVLTVAEAKPLMLRFWNEARADEPGALFWTGSNGAVGAVAIRSSDQVAVLLVNDEEIEGEE